MSEQVIWNPYWKRLLMLNTESVGVTKARAEQMRNSRMPQISDAAYAELNEIARRSRLSRARLGYRKSARA